MVSLMRTHSSYVKEERKLWQRRFKDQALGFTRNRKKNLMVIVIIWLFSFVYTCHYAVFMRVTKICDIIYSSDYWPLGLSWQELVRRDCSQLIDLQITALQSNPLFMNEAQNRGRHRSKHSPSSISVSNLTLTFETSYVNKIRIGDKEFTAKTVLRVPASWPIYPKNSGFCGFDP